MKRALITSLMALTGLATTEVGHVYPGAEKLLMHTMHSDSGKSALALTPRVLRSGSLFNEFVNQTANLTNSFVDNAANATNAIFNEIVNGTEHVLNKTLSDMQSNETYANIDDMFSDLIEEAEWQI